MTDSDGQSPSPVHENLSRLPLGELAGWVSGDGPRVLAVHGGPGMSYDYLDDAVDELAARYRVATFQQRGIRPSTEQGEFTVAEAVADIAAVLEGLEWETAYLMGSGLASLLRWIGSAPTLGH